MRQTLSQSGASQEREPSRAILTQCSTGFALEGGGAVISDDEGGVLQSVTFTPEQLALLGQTIMMSAWKGDIAR